MTERQGKDEDPRGQKPRQDDLRDENRGNREEAERAKLAENNGDGVDDLFDNVPL